MTRGTLALVLAACGAPPPPGCVETGGGYVGTIGDRPAFWCEPYYACGDHAEYQGETYAWDGVIMAGDTAERAEEDRLWCDRCGWAGEPAMILGYWPVCESW